MVGWVWWLFSKISSLVLWLYNTIEANICFYRGNQQHQIGNFMRAIESYDRVISVKPEYADAYYNKGTIF